MRMSRMVVATLMGCLAVAGCAAAAEEPAYSWQEQHATVLPKGDLEWAPRPFVFEAGESVRYIDYDAGDDSAAGTREVPWKHHPWDPEATGNAAACEGVHTYVFKRGVIYHGRLVADDSGEPGNPIRLTSDPTWGEGEAAIHGTVKLTEGWTRCTPETAPGIGEPDKVWYRDIGTGFFPRAVWQMRDGRPVRIPLARDPNWTVTEPDDVKSEWYEWQNTEKVEVEMDGGQVVQALCIDAEHLTAAEPDAYEGATVWSEYAGVMGTPYANRAGAYDPERGAILMGGPWGPSVKERSPIIYSRYFLENHPRFLDAPGEYWYDAEGANSGRLYVRLPGDADPNGSQVEVARYFTHLDIHSRSHIHVTGLTFRFNNLTHWYDRWWPIVEQDADSIKALGDCRDIRIANCRFEHVAMAVRMKAMEGTDVVDEIAITDNEITNTDYSAIALSDGMGYGKGEPPIGRLHRVNVLRNRLDNIGLRPMRAQQAHALTVNFASLVEVAGNVLDRCYGAGVFIFGGKGGGNLADRPLSRVLIHHNRATNTLLNVNDYGGIEFWQGGPAYVYNNVSGNPGGYWHWSHKLRGKTAEERNHGTARFGFAYYLDGAFKTYVFNNIGWGKSNDLTSPLCATSAYQEVIGFLNACFNNTFYNFGSGGRRHTPHFGRSWYLGNIWQDISDIAFRHSDQEQPEDANIARGRGEAYAVETNAYARNVFYGLPRLFGYFDLSGRQHRTLQDFRAALAERKPLAHSVGVIAQRPPLRDAAAHDFRLSRDRATTDSGVKLFVPWGLYATVGEWHFYKHPADPTRILDEHWFMTAPHTGRGMYRRLPRYDLKAVGVDVDDFARGRLEDWTDGVLRLDGHSQYCVLPDADLRGEDGSKANTVDMDTNSFLVEAYVRVEAGTTGGAIVSKMTEEAGCQLGVDQKGYLTFAVRGGGTMFGRTSKTEVNDGQWHHVIAQVDRTTLSRITLYVDGRKDQGAVAGSGLSGDVSLSNNADFLVGRDAEGSYLAGAIDFLRVARGTLADAETTIDELYAWQFDGPFLRDFAGNEPTGRRRDAGALEYRP